MEVQRSFTNRWFSWPWRPWVKIWHYTPRWPDPAIYMINDPIFGGKIMAMHPVKLEILVAALDKDKTCPK